MPLIVKTWLGLHLYDRLWLHHRRRCIVLRLRPSIKTLQIVKCQFTIILRTHPYRLLLLPILLLLHHESHLLRLVQLLTRLHALRLGWPASSSTHLLVVLQHALLGLGAGGPDSLGLHFNPVLLIRPEWRLLFLTHHYFFHAVFIL